MTDPQQPSDPLKQIAGLIQKLSYRDMQILAAKLNARVTGSTTEGDIAASLLLVCDGILVKAAIEDRAASAVYRR